MVKYYAKEDFLWFKKGHYIPNEEMQDNWVQHCLVEEEEPKVVVKKEEPKPISGDLDGDGDFDKDDLKIAGKVLAKGRKKSSRKKK